MSLARHTAYNIAGHLAPLVVTIITVPIYLRVVGIERYGLLAICWTLLSFVGFMSFGLGPAVARTMATLKDSSAAERARLFWTAEALSLPLALLGFLLVLVAGRLYFATVEVTGGLQQEVREAMPWLALAFAAAVAGGPVIGSLQGRQWFGPLNLAAIVASVALAVVPLVAAILLGPDLRTLVVATLMVNLAATGVQFTICARAVPLRGFERPSKALVRPLLSYGGWVTATAMLAPVVLMIDRFAIGAMIGAAAVSAYVIAYSLVSRIVLIAAALHSAALPRLAGAPAEEEERLKSVGLAALLAALTPICVLGLATLAPFLHLWVGSEIAAQAAPVAWILLAGFWVTSIAHIPATIVLGRGRPDLQTKLMLLYLLPYLGLLFLLLKTFGLLGAAAAWAIRSTFDLPLFAVSKPSKAQMRQMALGVGLVVASVLLNFALSWRSQTYWMLMIGLIGGSIVYGLKLAPAKALRLIARRQA